MSLSYSQLLALNEQQLEKMGVTKVVIPFSPTNKQIKKILCFQGARRKIAASVMRLRERPRILAEIDREVEEGRADLKRLLSELEAKKLSSFSL